VWGPETALEDSLRSDPSVQVRALAYRIAVEAVNNAAKHASADRIEVALATQDGGVRVTVRDDGTGFDTNSEAGPTHYGLRSMSERARAAGGWWRVNSAPGTGTTVEFFVPDDRPADER
jgi:signal transduction histidine kinase